MKKMNAFAGILPGRLASHMAKALAAIAAAVVGLGSFSAMAQPAVSVQPKDYTAPLGGSVAFRVAGTPANATYQWQLNGFNVSSATTAKLTLTNLTRSSAGTYTVIVRNGSSFVRSSPAVLTVMIPPAITSQPTGADITSGKDYTFSAVATGDAPLSYQWSVDGVDIAGATNTTLTLNTVTLGDNGAYRVKVSNPVGNVTSSPAALAAFIPPTIATQPSGQTNAAGQSVTFTVVANGTAPLSYQWLYNGLTLGGPIAANTLTFPSLTYAQNNGQISVIVANAGGSVTSSVVSLGVTTPVLPSITSTPIVRTVAIGDRTTLSVSAAGTPTLTYQWTLNGSTTIPGTTSTTGSTLSINPLAAGNAGNYSVTVTSPYGSASALIATLIVKAPVAPVFAFTNGVHNGVSPTNVVVLEGGSFTLTGYLNADVFPLSAQWYFAGSSGRGAMSGQTNLTLTVSNVTAAQGGTYQLLVTNIAGLDTSDQIPVSIFLKPRFTTKPASRTVGSGSSVSLVTAASGSAPIQFQWRINDIFDIDNETNKTLVLSNVTTAYNGTYYCVATNAAGSDKTLPGATITVLNRPTITTGPASQTVAAGANVTFTVAASGSNVGYQWAFKGSNIPGQTTSSLLLTNVQTANSGDYTVTVYNDVDSATATATLTVIQAPAITSQPQNTTADASTTATFSVTATGNPLNYQWYFGPSTNKIALSGATNATLSLPNVGFGLNNGIFSVTITNTAGTVTSSYVTLSVVAARPPTITTQPTRASVGPGGSVTFSVGVAGTPPFSYQWRVNGINIGGATASTLALNNIGYAYTGDYSVQVSNLVGVVTSQAARLTVASTSIKGQWDFNSSNLVATIGNDLTTLGDTAAFTKYTNVVIGGSGKTVLSFPAATSAQGYVMTHGIAPGTGGGTKVNKYTLIMDVLYPAGSTGFKGLLQTDTSNASDSDLFLNGANGIGISGQYEGNATLGDWHRLAFAFDLSSSNLWKYVDGALVGQHNLSSGIDGRFSLDSTALLFTDNNNETQAGYVSSIQIHNDRLTTSQIQALGGATGFGITTTTPSP